MNYIVDYITLVYFPQNLNEKQEKEKKKRSKKDLRLTIPKPTPIWARSGVLKTKTVRSLEKRREMELKTAKALAQKFKKFAQVIRVPFTLESHRLRRKKRC